MRVRRPNSKLALAALLAAITTAVPALAQPATTAAAPGVTRPAALIDLDPGRIAADQVATLARTLSDPTVDQDARDNAARRLLAIGSAEARSAVQFALRDPGNNAGRLAAARAVADDAPPDPEFIDALFVLLETDVPRPVADAAAVALGNYKMEPDVAARLVVLTGANRPDAVRIAAIRALSTQIEKRAAQRLVELAADANPTVSAAASSALETFASLPLRSAVEWAAWWRTQADQPDDRFRLEMLSARATRFEQVARHGEETFQELRRSVLNALAGTPKEQKGDALIRYLTSPREAVRLIAVRQAYEFATTGDLPVAVTGNVRQLLADPSADIRYEAARTMQFINDGDAFTAIAQQLAVESDSRVRAELARSLGPIGNVAAVPLLRWLLEDSSPPVVQSAASAIARLAPTIAQGRPTDAADLAAQLQRLLERRAPAGVAATQRLRESLLEAVVPLRQPAMMPTFRQILTATPPEAEPVRRLAAMGLGAIGQPESADLLVEVMRDESPAVRIEAVRALGKISNSFIYAEALYRALDVAREKDPTVRAASWSVLKDLLPVAPRKQLADWPDRPLIRDDDLRRLDLFTALAQKAEQAGAADDQTFYLQQVGDTLMKLGDELANNPAERAAATRRYSEANAHYQQALAITRATQGPSMRVERLVEWTMKSLLRSGDYAGAVRFASDLVRQPGNASYQGIVGAEFKLEAERLVNERSQFDDALKLIREAMAMTPALPAQYRDHLADVQRSVERRMQEKNQYAVPEFLHVLAMR